MISVYALNGSLKVVLTLLCSLQNMKIKGTQPRKLVLKTCTLLQIKKSIIDSTQVFSSQAHQLSAKHFAIFSPLRPQAG